MVDLRITKENPEAIAFVFACCYSESLTMEEVNKWADFVLLNTDDYPEYILELCVYKGFLKDFYKIMGFSPSSDLSENENMALHAIADSRGVNRYEPEPTREAAKIALENNSQILIRFKEQFPFVQLNS